MGSVKALIQERQDLERLAVDYLVHLKMLKRCPPHNEIVGQGPFDLEKDFWPRIMADRKRGVDGPVPWAAGLKGIEFTDLIKEVYEEHRTDECHSCNKMLNE